MKKIYVGIAALAIVSGAAQAQSNVTLYGVIDAGVNYVDNSNGSKLWQVSDGTFAGIYGSRWGLKGDEDLGDGLKVVFKLENGFNVFNGKLLQGGREFGRQAYVGMSSNQFGTLTLGRQYDSIVDFVQPITFTGQWGGMFVHSGDIDNTTNSFRVSNAVKFASANYSGLTFGGMYAFSNSNAPGVSTTGMWSAGARYANGPLSLGAAYFFAKNPASFFPDGDFIGNTTGSAVGASGPFSYVGNPSNQQIVGFGGTYAIGLATIGLDYTHTMFDNANGTRSSVKFDNYEVWTNYALSPATTLGAGYTFTSGKVDYSGVRPKYHQFGLVGDYKLSKRTEAYVLASFQRAAGDAPVADIFDGSVASASTNKKQTAFRLGVVRKF